MLPTIVGLNQDVPTRGINISEKECIYEALWHEARGESKEGIHAVASVIQNRVYSGRYPKNFCEVVQQGRQFSYRNRKGVVVTPTPNAFQLQTARVIDRLSTEMLTGEFKASVAPSVLWYHTKKVKPQWSKQFKKVKVIGNHVFYSEN